MQETDLWRPKYDLRHHIEFVAKLHAARAFFAVKGIAGLLKPTAVRTLFNVLRDSADITVHFHTHDTSGTATETVLAAIKNGVGAVDAAMDAFSANTSQPCLGSIVEALKGVIARPDSTGTGYGRSHSTGTR
ncbi:hypothetical protein [Pelagibius sp.]|uniref:hypothetical protein n=1 Tax=Pelagibius sp. TaxID=1931238 RepID=UPI003B4FFEC0